jgi:hypothetical protein
MAANLRDQLQHRGIEAGYAAGEPNRKGTPPHDRRQTHNDHEAG